MEMKIDRRIFNEAYLPYLFDYSHRYECYYGGAGSGKSVFIAQKLLIKAIKSKRKILIMRKVGNTSKDSTFQLMKDTLQQFKLYNDCKINKSDLSIDLKNGSSFLFKGLDDPEKIKSITNITDIWFEEVTEATLDDVSQLDLRLRAKADKLQFFFSFNPISKDNFVYTYFHREEGDQVPDDMLVVKTTYADNKFLPQSFVDSLMKMKESNPVYFKIYVEGDFATLDKLIFNFEVKDFDWREVDGMCCFGLDFGYVNDPSAFIALKVDQDKREIYIFDEIYEKALKNNELAGRIIAKGYSKEEIIADCQERKSIDELRYDYNIRRIKRSSKGRGSILQGIQYLQQFKLFVNPLCKNTITELSNYSWKKNRKTGEYINEPIDHYNHLMDAMRYAVQSVRRGRVTVMSKSSLGL